MNLKRKEIIIEIIAVLFILLFVYAGTSKWIDYTKFRVELGKSPLLTNMAPWVAVIVPAIEIIIAAMLAMPRFRLMALYVSFTLMVMFTAYIIAILEFSDFVPCTCGGVLQNMTWTQHLIFNMAFIGLAAAGVLLHTSPTSVTNPPVSMT
jgi:uncharacterized membrane protein YphA (DoxX/SURF4 family)